MPYGMERAAFNNGAVQIMPAEGHIKAMHAAITFDAALPYREIVDHVNTKFRELDTLKVPFMRHVAPEAGWWQAPAHKEFSIDIGKHGTELQSLTFDNQDDNQALLIGKPGSGKSNLLHAIIINALWKYSPREIEIHLIDFKGGVEFSIYADRKIPHIRTIAIESEREFGLSVLDGAEQALLKRELVFSQRGVSNIEEFREKFPQDHMPRILLIVDEFQEFFVEDDAIKEAVNAKFDRIVKKGRALGINTLFASQTLSGKSMERGTRELIDIRIALMCSDTDARVILSEKNAAATDLTRPGEGIYNDEGGKPAGNRRFQAFFIEKGDLGAVIDKVAAYATTHADSRLAGPQIVFRGSERAHIEKVGHPVSRLVRQTSPRAITLWLGSPVEIAPEVAATLYRRAGSNLLVVGHDDELCSRILASSVLSANAHYEPAGVTFHLLDFVNPDSPAAGVAEGVAGSLSPSSSLVRTSRVKEVLEQVKTLVGERTAQPGAARGDVYVVIFAFNRARAFRKENSYSMNEEGQLLAHILKEGPDVGVFCLLHVDSMENFGRNLDDGLMQQFSHRIATQMNPDNSVRLIGSQKAARLGANRALMFDDNENRLSKFKPYELPNPAWLAQLGAPKSAALD